MTEPSSLASIFGDLYPYKSRFKTYSQIPEKGTIPEEIY